MRNWKPQIVLWTIYLLSAGVAAAGEEGLSLLLVGVGVVVAEGAEGGDVGGPASSGLLALLVRSGGPGCRSAGSGCGLVLLHGVVERGRGVGSAAGLAARLVEGGHGEVELPAGGLQVELAPLRVLPGDVLMRAKCYVS